jgi:hypothetical protein
MSYMNIPGFIDEAAIVDSKKNKLFEMVYSSRLSQLIIPQARNTGGGTSSDRAKAICNAGCLGGYFGDSFGCVNDPHPDICRSIAKNVYSRCTSRCSGL